MGSLPRAKAGVGSAVNDTTRQMGGAVGVAVLGSLLSSHYSSALGDKLGNGVDPKVLSSLQEGVGQAVGIGRSLPGGDAIVAAARDSFVGGMHVSAVVAACVTLTAAAAVAKWLPARARDDAAFSQPLPPLDAAASEGAPDDRPVDVETAETEPAGL
jgi:hypothetical protein